MLRSKCDRSLTAVRNCIRLYCYANDSCCINYVQIRRLYVSWQEHQILQYGRSSIVSYCDRSTKQLVCICLVVYCFKVLVIIIVVV